MEKHLANYQDQSVLSNEVQDILGKKFSWIIRYGNVLLLVSIALIGVVAISLKIPVFFKTNAEAVLMPQKEDMDIYQVTFKVPISQIRYFEPDTKLRFSFSFLPEQNFEATVTQIGSEVAADSLTVVGVLKVNLSDYTPLAISMSPAEVELKLGEKNMLNYFIQ